MSGIWFDVGLHSEQLKQDIVAINSQIKRFTSGVERETGAINSKLGGLGQTLKDLVPAASLASVGLFFTKIAKDALNFSKDFEAAMKEVETVSQSTKDNFGDMSKAIIDMSANGPQSAIELAQAYYEIASAGHDGADGLKILEIASKSAIAGVTDTKTAADGLTTVLNAWGLEASASTKVADVFFKTVEKGKTTFPELSNQIAQVAPLASSMGISFDEVAAAVATLTKQGTPTAQAMTQIRSSLINMNKVLGDGWADTMSYQEGLSQIAKMAGGSQNELRKLIPDIEGINAVLALTGDKAQEAATDLKDMATATGAMNTAFGTMMEAADNKWSVVLNKWNRELKKVGDTLKEGSLDIADKLNEILTNREADVVLPGVAKEIGNISGQLDSLGTREEKLQFLVNKMIDLKNATIQLNAEESKLTKEQPGGLKRGIEAFNAGIGLGDWATPGRVKQTELEILQDDIEINKRVSQELAKLYQKVLGTPSQTVPDNTNSGKVEAHVKTLKEAEQNIKDLEEKIGTGTIEQDVQIYMKIANEQEFIDSAYQKIRGMMSGPFELVIDSLQKGIANAEAKMTADNIPETLAKVKELQDQLDKLRNPVQSKNELLPVKSAKETLKPMKELTAEERKQLDIQQKKIDNQIEFSNLTAAISKTLYDSSEILGSLSMAIGEIDSDLGQSIGKMSDLAYNASTLVTNLATGGNPVAAATSGIAMIGNILGWYQQTVTSAEELTEAEARTREQALKLNDIYRERLRLLELLGLISPFQSYIDDIDVLNQKLATGKTALDSYQQNFLLNGKQTSATIKQIFDTVYGADWGAKEMSDAMSNWDEFFEKYLKIVGGKAYTNHPLSGFHWIMDKNQFNEDLNFILETASEIENRTQEMMQNLTGTNTEGIAQSIIDGFKNGYSSMKDFATTFEDLLRDAIYKAIQDEILNSALLKNFYEKLYEYAEGGFTQQEIDDLRTSSDYGWNALVNASKNITDGLRQISGLDFSNEMNTAKSLPGSIQNITEETAGLIAGQFYAMRELQQKQFLNGVSQLEVINQTVTHLASIDRSTLRILNVLSDEISSELRNINSNLKNI